MPRSSDAALTDYRARRDFARTPEPAGNGRQHARMAYCMQWHAARRLHHDLRLQLGGVLKSWAVPRGPSYDPDERRLAVATEDHPLAYRHFEGVIPAGAYGAGTMMLWDEGTWEPVGDPQTGLMVGKLVFVLHGHKCQGEWTLVRLGGGRSWLLIKHRDRFAVAGLDVVRRFPHSIRSGRSMEQIVAAATKV